MPPGSPILRVDRLQVSTLAGRRIVDDVSFDMLPGEIVALVGESGSGKTTIGRAILRLLPNGLACTGGDITLRGESLTATPQRELRKIRGGSIAAVFQDPMASLNPSLKVGRQMMEALRLHEDVDAHEARLRCLAMLERVRIENPQRCFDEYPGKFSGGMRQRFMLASVLLTRPAVLIADEPTTALDAIVRREIMEQAVELTREVGTAILLVSHDLGMVAQYAERSVVLKGGRVMDQGDARQVLLQPRVDYTRTLLDAFPERALAGGGSTRRSPLVRVRNIDVAFRKGRRSILSRKEYVRAVKDVSFDIRSGEVLAVVGESGSGKSTVGKALVDLYKPSRGEILFANGIERSGGGKGGARTRPQVQMIFQDAGGSLDPRMTIKQAVAEPLRAGGIAAAAERLRRAKDMLAEVGLGDDMHDCYPHQLSGGQRQRVGIARAIVGGGDLIVADEPVSALDVSIQRQILDLLKQLHSAYGLTYLFISHDLDVVEELADRVMVMQRGCLVEIGSRDAVFDDPRHPYTRALLEATPRIRRVAPSRYALASLTNRHADPPLGHRFDVPVAEPPEHAVETACMVEVADDHFVRCIPSVERGGTAGSRGETDPEDLPWA